MKNQAFLRSRASFGMSIAGLAALLFAGCGGSTGGASSADTVAVSPTAAQVATYTDTQIVALGTGIHVWDSAALGALSFGTNATHPTGQIQSLSAGQIAALSPTQVHAIGATGPGGVAATSAIRWLNAGAWAALAANTVQVAAITSAEMPTLTDREIADLGLNVSALSPSALGAMGSWLKASNTDNPVGQIETLSAVQIAALSPSQVRFIGATGAGGVMGTSQIRWLNSGAWGTLVANPAQVAAMTAEEIGTITDIEVSLFGANLNLLSNGALAALKYDTNLINPIGQVQSISASQVVTLSSAQIAAFVSKRANIAFLNSGAVSVLSAAQVAVLTPSDFLLVSPGQLALLSPSALAGLAPVTIASLTPAQKTGLTPTQHSACGC
ncbi:MAG: hypothetical protein Q7S87_01115 [Agitococcus sp.]|nr:hypothetical protein [Agitococcus sp.]